MPPAMASRVVWFPASTRSSQYETSWLWVSGTPSISLCTSWVTRSSCGSCAALRHHLLEVAVQLAAGPHGGLLRALAGTPVLGIVLADDLVGPPEVVLPVGVGHTEDPGDDGHRKRCGEGVDEVALADLVPRSRPGRRARRRSGSISSLRARTALFRNFLLATCRMGPCCGRVEIDDHLRRHVEPAEVHVQGDPPGAREELGLRGHLHDVGVLGDRPEGRVARRLDVGHRRLGPQPGPDLVRIAVAARTASGRRGRAGRYRGSWTCWAPSSTWGTRWRSARRPEGRRRRTGRPGVGPTGGGRSRLRTARQVAGEPGPGCALTRR